MGEEKKEGRDYLRGTMQKSSMCVHFILFTTFDLSTRELFTCFSSILKNKTSNSEESKTSVILASSFSLPHC